MSNFHVGQAVVCVSGNFDHPRVKAEGITVPLVGCIYTVRDIVDDYRHGNIGLLLNEIINPEIPVSDRISTTLAEPTFNIVRFRPAVKTDISIFTEMLNKMPEVV